MALRAWRLLANGSGGLDWSGLPIVAEMLGIDDPQTLIERMTVIRTYRPKDASHGTGDTLD